MKQNARVQAAIYDLFPQYTRKASEKPHQVFNEVINHFYNRYRYTWIVYDYARFHQRFVKVKILTKDGKRSQDQSSGQGKGVHAAHVARFGVNHELQKQDSEMYRFFLELLSVTENVPAAFNQGGIAYDIDKISYELLDSAKMDLNTWTIMFQNVLVKHFLNDQLLTLEGKGSSSIASVAHYTTDIISKGAEDFKKLMSDVEDALTNIKKSYESSEKQM